jgi:hypothetical protein
MALQTPPRIPWPDADVNAGVIEDARARQRRHRAVGLLAVLVVGLALIAELGAGGSGGHRGGAGRTPGGHPPGPKVPSLHSPSQGLAGAPATQRAALDGVSSWQCPAAPRNRYLPAHAGCVTVTRVDMTGGARRDLVIVFSHLTPTRPLYPGEPPRWKHYSRAHDATLEVILPDGRRISTQVMVTASHGPALPVHVAAIVAAQHVNHDPGAELFLEVGDLSSGSTAVAYALRHDRLVPAGVVLGYGGDSGTQAGFSCDATTRPPELIQRVFAFGARGLRGPWEETEAIAVWHGPALHIIRRRTLSRRGGNPSPRDIAIGSGCGPVGAANRVAKP